MARVQFSALVTDMKGRLGGSVFQGSNGGTILRNNVWRGPSKTIRWQNARIQLVHFSIQWQQLFGPNKNSWHAFASTVPATNAFGDPITLSGQHVFIMCNRNRQLCGLPLIVTPVLQQQLSTLLSVGISQSLANVLSIKWVNPDANYNIIVQCKRQYPGNNQTSPGGYKQILSLQIMPPNSQDITSKYEAAYGAVLAGASFNYRYKTIHRASGIASVWYEQKSIVA